jgi:hypothetical protein
MTLTSIHQDRAPRSLVEHDLGFIATARDGDALLLAAGNWPGNGLRLQSDPRQPFFGNGVGLSAAFLHLGEAEGDVALRRHVRNS